MSEKSDAVDQGVPFLVDGSHPSLFDDEALSSIEPYTSVHASSCIFDNSFYDNTISSDFLCHLIDKTGRKWALMKNSHKRIELFKSSLRPGTTDCFLHAGKQPLYE